MGIKSNSRIFKIALKSAKQRGLAVCGAKAETYAKKLCPVRTGRLRNSISHGAIDENTEVIGTDVEYAIYVEVGTHKQAAKPFLRPAVEDHAEEYKQILENALRGG